MHVQCHACDVNYRVRLRGVRTTHEHIFDVDPSRVSILRDAYETAREIGRGS